MFLPLAYLLLPMLSDGIGGVDDGTVEIEQESGKGVTLRLTRKGAIALVWWCHDSRIKIVIFRGESVMTALI